MSSFSDELNIRAPAWYRFLRLFEDKSLPDILDKKYETEENKIARMCIKLSMMIARMSGNLTEYLPADMADILKSDSESTLQDDVTNETVMNSVFHYVISLFRNETCLYEKLEKICEDKLKDNEEIKYSDERLKYNETRLLEVRDVVRIVHYLSTLDNLETTTMIITEESESMYGVKNNVHFATITIL
jgi:hypothetical protein